MSTITWLISQLIHRSIRQPTHLGRHIDRHSTDMWTDISADTLLLCRPRHRSSVGRYFDRDIDRYIGRGVHKIHMIQRKQGSMLSMLALIRLLHLWCRSRIIDRNHSHQRQQSYWQFIIISVNIDFTNQLHNYTLLISLSLAKSAKFARFVDERMSQHGGKHAVSMHRPFVSSSIACTTFGVFKDMPKGYLCGHFALDDVKFGC